METLMFGTPETQAAVMKEKSLLMIDESAPIESVYVNVWSDEELVHEAAVEVKYVSGSLGVNSMDPRMGALENTPCETCNLEHPRCPGHWGYIDLKETLVHSSYVHKQLVQMIFSCVCIHCRRPYADFDRAVNHGKRVPRLTACYEYVKNKDGECAVCGKKIYSIIEDDNRNPKLNKYSEMEIGIDKANTMSLPLKILREIFLGLDVSHRKTLGIEGVDTEDFFFTKLPVMPNNVRPKRNFEGKEEMHQFTILYEKIAKAVDDMKRQESNYKNIYDREREMFYRKIYLETLFELNDSKPELLTAEEQEMVARTDLPKILRDYELMKTERDRASDEAKFYSWKNKRRIVNLHVREFDNAYGQQTFQVRFSTPGSDKSEKFTPVLKKSEGVNIDMNTLIKSKHGLVREKIMGKRVNFCARTVASPAPFRGRSDEVWIPEKFRNTLLMLETVTPELRDSLRRMADNRMIVYVILKDPKHADVPFRGERTNWGKYLYHLRTNRIQGHPVDNLADGDEVERQLIEGVNYVLLNRQPSIWRYSLGAFRARFWENGTIGVPDVALKAFNGDFDGDEFNIWTIRDKKTEAEVIQMFSPVRNVLGNARNSTAYGLHYDPVTGVFLITRVVERKLPLPNIEDDYRKISDFLGTIETQYFEEQNEKLNTRRYFRIYLRKEGNKNVVVFSSETVIPRDYFIDEVKEHIYNMKGRDLTSFHRKLERLKMFYVPESDSDHKSLGRSYCGRAAFSLLLPADLNFDNGKVKIEGGVLVKGTVSKSEIGAFSHATIFHELTRLYGFEMCAQVMDCLVWFTKTYLTRGNTISFNLEDYGFVGRDAERETDRIVWVRKLVSEYQSVYDTLKKLALEYKPQLDAQNVKVSINRILQDVRRLRATEEVKGFLADYCSVEDEKSARNLLLAAATLEEKNESVYQEVRIKVEDLERQKKDAESKREFNRVEEIEGKIIDLLNGIRAQEAKNIESVVDPDNAFMKCEGKRGNIYEVMGSVGLQTVSGKRIYTGSASNRALPSIFPGDTSPEALGMVLGNFTRGLDPSEAAFLSWAARIGPVVTKTQTSVIGDIANRMTNAFQGIVMRDGAPQETVREMANVVQMSYNYDNIDPKYLIVRKGDQQFSDNVPPSLRSDYKADKPGQTTIDVSNIQVRLSAMGGRQSQLKTEDEVARVNRFLRSRVINSYSVTNAPTDGSVYLVKGVSFVTTQRSVDNVRNMLRQAMMSLKFPDEEETLRVAAIDETLEDILTRMTGVKKGVRVVENVHVGQGDKVGRFISGAIQQPIMQAALNTFHASGQASSASNVKDRFIRLVTASAAGKRSGTMILNKSPKTFYEAYRARNALREITLASILKNPAPEMYYDVKHTETVPVLVRKLMEIEHPSQSSIILSPSLDNICFIVFDYDPLVLRTAGIATTDLKRFLVNISVKNFSIIPVVTKDRIYLFTTETNSLKARDGFQRNVIARLSDHKLNFGYRFSGEGMEELYPTEYRITDGIKSVYKNGNYVVQMNRRHMGRFGYTMRDVQEMFTAAGISPQSMIIDDTLKRIQFTNLATSPVKLVESKMAEESDIVEAEWKASVEAGKPKEPVNPGFVTSKAVGYYLKTIGGTMNFMMRNPMVNYRSSYTDGILDIEETLGLRAARNFMVHEIEQIFALSGANEIDYRHVVLMIDSMVSQGSISRLTFQGVDKMAGPNPLNQAGVGFAPAATFAMAALKKKDFAADAGYAVNFLATKPKIVRERVEEETLTLRSQEDKIKQYMAALPSIKKTNGQRTEVDYQVLKSKRQAERTVIDNVTPYDPLPKRPVDVNRPATALCERPVVAYPRALEYDLGEFYDGFRNGLDIFGLPTTL
jgi:DNA-directed RNA polymerase beta' subunit